ncbi:glycoside hydrolase family 3 C-terminal domain-containing protein [Flaviramulus sp. BrNp1-15]|uniref:glycoside hydrolase family 3 C-terminal domain-containing protein n=1 Tax=Flaviramulus sp. BrNp1-15 TaxID=2916754 RepID=UPI001EE8C49A|nr:glycoside hydrolase family 3 C-terminal domain-containing protein [Flaviramulus sp. BrNp1-15]ULC57968.1 glycoside hydrolase family 3 C-terminal domain-containing protein [Flaviramulus sp. BrNp1-15]
MKTNRLNKLIKTSLLSLLIITGISCKNNKKVSEEKEHQTITLNGHTFKDLNNNGELDAYEDSRLTIEERVQDLIEKLTDEEKADLVVGIGMPGFDFETMQFSPNADLGKVPGSAGGTKAIERLGLPSIIVADGPAGLRISPERKNDTNTYFATAFPVGTALASTWNETLINSVGKAMGNEVKEYGVDVILGPGMNIHRNPLCGRNFEYYSEDPVQSGKIAAAMVNGIQSNGVGTSIKHYVANNQERNRMGINAHVSERAMREIYLRGFEITVKDAQPWTIMSSYNLVNGTYTSSSKDLLTTILRDEWGFKGLVMTDWFGGYNNSHFNPDILKNEVSDVASQLAAGNDLLMPGLPKQKETIIKNVEAGNITNETINTNLKRVLALVLKSPAMNNYKFSNKPDLKEHADITRQVAAEATILLKNDNNTLPFNSKSSSLAVFGNTSYNFIAGGTGSGDVNEAYTISLIEGLTNAGFSIDKELEGIYVPYVEKQNEEEMARREKEGGILAVPKRIPELELDKSTIQNKANSSEIAIITIGRNAGESGDRKVEEDFNLAQDEVNLINNVSEAFHAKGKKVVVVLNIGGVIETASWKNKVDAIILPWQPGQEGGNSVADVFTGKVAPSGKLTMTFPVNYEDAIATKNWIGTPADNPTSVSYEEGIYVGYRYFNTFNVKPSYEFGYGLSYTTFDYSNLTLNTKTFTDKISVSVNITNTGKTAGKEVVQLYLSAPEKSIDKPKEELKAFGKTKVLQPGESQTITLTLNAKDLASFVPNRNAWVADAGTYKLLIGASSLNIKQTVEFSVENEIVAEKTNPTLALDIQFTDLKH